MERALTRLAAPSGSGASCSGSGSGSSRVPPPVGTCWWRTKHVTCLQVCFDEAKVHLHVWGGLPPYPPTEMHTLYCTSYLLPPTSHLLLRTLHFLSHHTTPHRTAPRRATPPPRAPIERIGCRSRSLLPIGMWERGMASGGCGSLAVLTLLLHARHGAPGCPLLHTDHTPCASLSLSLLSNLDSDDTNPISSPAGQGGSLWLPTVF